MSQWIAAITRGHNGGVCLLKDGEIIFALEEERLSRQKYDGGPFATMIKILEYTDKLDYLVIAHTQPLSDAGRVDFSGEDVYTGLARKLGLIDRQADSQNHPQVIDLSKVHHKLHAACAFYRSGFDTATAVVVDGAGTFIPMSIDGQTEMTWELESIFECSYPSKFNTLYKHQGGRGPWRGIKLDVPRNDNEDRGVFELVLDDTAGITKAYEAVTQYCGWQPIEAGKTMGLFPYGKENKNIPPIYTDAGGEMWRSADRNLVIPTYPNGAKINEYRYKELATPAAVYEDQHDVTLLDSRRDLAYAIQTQSQEEVLSLIIKAVEISGNNNVVLSGGYGLNCVANYFYLTELNKLGINLYVEPISNDAGTCIGAALLMYHQTTNDSKIRPYVDNLYLGPSYTYSKEDILAVTAKYNATGVYESTNADVVNLLRDRNIVAMFQGCSESGPRALGNRSILFDPSVLDGKDYVNSVKHREYFRPLLAVLWQNTHTNGLILEV